MKQTIAYSFSFFLLIILLTACGNNATSSPAQALSPTAKVVPSETNDPSATIPIEVRATPESKTPTIATSQTPDPREYVIGMGLAKDILWIITPERVVRFDMRTGKSNFFEQSTPHFNGNFIGGGYLNSIVTDLNGKTWFSGSALTVYDGKNWKFYTTDDGLASMEVHDIEIDRAGMIWIATDSGVNSFNGNIWKTYTTEDGLTDNYVWDIAIDQAGNKWFGTESGISRFNGAAWESWTYEAGTFPIGAPVYSIGFDTKENVYAATDIAIAIFDGSEWSFAYPKGWDVWCHLEFGNGAFAFDKQGNLWSGSDENGVRVYDGTSVTTYTITDGLADNEIWGIFFDPAGNPWITTGRGISKYNGENWTNYIINRDAIEVYVQIPDMAPDSPVAIGAQPSARTCNDSWSGLEPGVDAIVVADWPLEVFSKPEQSASQYYLGRINPGTIVKILKGPVGVKSGELYWKVETPAIPGAVGWIPEGYILSDEHWLEPYMVPAPVCGIGWSRLEIGKSAIITPGDPNWVRSDPGKGGNTIGKVYPGTIVKILEGPVCTDGLVFWKVENASIPGGSGWTAEGDGTEYWLEPYEP